jgi:alpha-beta hydrolase superfamily lysophospholipase
MQTVFLILTALVAAAVVLSLLIAWKVSHLILHPRVFAYNAVVDEEIRRGHFTRAWFDQNVHLEEFTLRSGFGYDLHAAVWPREKGASFPDGKRRVAVLVHGFNYSLLGQIKYASMFHALGFDCVLYDHRNHGLSGKAATTMGLYESRDLATICAWARERYGEDAVLGTLGESMGAATVMLHAKDDHRLSFAVEDCGFSDFYALMRAALPKRFHLPAFPILPLMNIFCMLREGISLKEIRPADALKDCPHVPMLFVHGDADELIPARMMQACYDAKSGEKEAWLVPGARHADSYRADPEGYRAHLSAFLKNHGVI